MDERPLNQDDVLARALKLCHGNRAELARRVGRSEPAVSRWFSGHRGLDFESALRLARVAYLPAPEVLRAFGLDESLLPNISQGAANVSSGFGETVDPVIAEQYDQTVAHVRDLIRGVPLPFVKVILAATRESTSLAKQNVDAALAQVAKYAVSLPENEQLAPPEREAGATGEGEDLAANDHLTQLYQASEKISHPTTARRPARALAHA